MAQPELKGLHEWFMKMATVTIEVTDYDKGGITSTLLGDLAGPISGSHAAAIFVKQQLDRTVEKPYPYCLGEEP